MCNPWKVAPARIRLLDLCGFLCSARTVRADDVLVRHLWDMVVAEAPKKEGTACTPPMPSTRLPGL